MEEAIINKILLKRKLALEAVMLITQKYKKRKRRWQVNPKMQSLQGTGENLIKELRLSSKEYFFNYTRLSLQQYDLLLSMVKDKLTKKNTFRKPISPEIRLTLTLRHLALGDSLTSLSEAFQVGKSTSCNIIKETCDILWETLSPIYLKVPSQNEWIQIANEFETRWNLPNCLGAIDGKVIVVQSPHNNNAATNSSIILFATCDAYYQFTYVDIGTYNCGSNGAVLRESELGTKLFKGDLNIPPDKNIQSTNIKLPYYFVGDEVFPLHRYLLRPYGGPNMDREKRIFNYRLTRAFQCIENTFGILISRFKVFHKVINAHPDTVDSMLKATVCLHNFIRNEEIYTESKSKYCPETYVDRYEEDGNIIPGEWRNNIPKNSAMDSARTFPRRIGSRNATRDAEDNRFKFKNYLNSPEGALPCQEYLIQ